MNPLIGWIENNTILAVAAIIIAVILIIIAFIVIGITKGKWRLWKAKSDAETAKAGGVVVGAGVEATGEIAKSFRDAGAGV